MTSSKSRDKGTRFEYKVRDALRAYTGKNWERVPGSGGFNAAHGLKGDLYIPGEYYKYCIEAKHYADDVITSNLLKDSTHTTLEKFWEQTVREAGEINKEPLLVFKKDHGPMLVGTLDELPLDNLMLVKGVCAFYIYDFLDWLDLQKPSEL